MSLGNISKGSQGTHLLGVFIILHMRRLLGTVGSPRHSLGLCLRYIQHRAALTAALLLFVVVVTYLEQKPVSARETALLWGCVSQPEAVQSACAGVAGKQVGETLAQDRKLF